MNYKSENIPGSVDEVISSFNQVGGAIKKYPGLTCIAGVLLVLVGLIVSTMSYQEYKKGAKTPAVAPAKKTKAEETKGDVPEEDPSQRKVKDVVDETKGDVSEEN